MSEHKHTNALINESSPYLLQHAHNPVNWYAWNDEALAKAKKEDKPILVSVGYAACHWCHVMEHESFEDEEVAQIMNEHFICIKVDREERPDVDQVYMQAVQILSGRGGWPLNCFALPDSRPFYGGTYFPKENWKNILKEIARLFRESRNDVVKQAGALTSGVERMDLIIKNVKEDDFPEDLQNKIWKNWQNNLDSQWGGRVGAPKFPMSIGLEYLLKYYAYNQDENIKKALELNLDRMALGGIYDQVGGGFSRYSVDDRWHVPHFEKMLYDNGQLLTVYTQAYRLYGKDLYKQTVEQTVDFIERELMDDSGAFYASLDADSEGEEGKFYVWQKSEIEALFGDEAELVKDYYNIDGAAFWEKGNNVLFVTDTDAEIAQKYNLSLEQWVGKKKRFQSKMLEERSKRIRPALDDKILCSWNALTIKGLAESCRSFEDIKYLGLATKNAEFILQNMKTEQGGLWRNFKNGKASIAAFLEDYAFLIDAFIALYQASFEQKWLLEARQLMEYCLANFFDVESGMFYYTDANASQLVARKMEISDNVIPASNSQMGNNLFLLGSYFDEREYIQKAKQMLLNVQDQLEAGGAYYSNWAILLNYFQNPPFEIAITGPEWKQLKTELEKEYLPNALLMGGLAAGNLPLLEGKSNGNETLIYVCVNKACQLPVKTTQEALKQIRS